MSYVRNLPYSGTYKSGGVVLHSPPPKSVATDTDAAGAGYLVESSGLRITSGSERLDTVLTSSPT